MNTKKDYSPHFVFLPKNELEKKAIQTNLNNQGKLLISPFLNPGRKGKPQPGYFAGYDHIQDDEYKCENFYNRIRDDIPGSYLTSFEEPCEKGFHKAFMAIDDKKEYQDYHFYRQDNNGHWSHKPGRTEAQDIDASQKKITNPLTAANRDYTHFAYKKPCFFFCVNPKLGRTHSKKINTKKSIFNFDF